MLRPPWPLARETPGSAQDDKEPQVSIWQTDPFTRGAAPLAVLQRSLL